MKTNFRNDIIPPIHSLAKSEKPDPLSKWPWLISFC